MQILRKLSLYMHFMGKSDKNCNFKCKYLGNITPCGPLGTDPGTLTKIHIWMAKTSLRFKWI